MPLLSTVSSSPLPPLLYLPGMDGTGKLFYRQATSLANDFSIRCLTFPTGGQETWLSLAADVRAQLDRPTWLCGESFGACLALQVAAEYPDCCAGLILVNPASSFRRGSVILAGRMLLPFLPDPIYRWASERGLSWLSELNRIAPADQQIFAQAVQSVPLATTVHRLALLSQFQPDPLPLESLQMPTLLIGSKRDRLLPSLEEVYSLAKRIPTAQVEIAPYSGHACLLEQDFSLRQLLQKRQLLPEPIAVPSP